MLAFNAKENLILYWDEPTITLDYPDHEMHALIKANWQQNLVPNIVLSSATLPQKKELAETILDFQSRFPGADIQEIVSHDCKKTIPLINRDGFIELPHYLSADYKEILEIVAHCRQYPTLLRYLDLREIIRFLLIVDDYDILKNNRYEIATTFPEVGAVNMATIKIYYLNVLGNLNPKAWPPLSKKLHQTRAKKQESNIQIVTTDAHTLTDGPTIFLADDVNQIAQFCLQSAAIPLVVMKDIMAVINYNADLNMEIAKLEKDYEDGTNDETTATKEKKKDNKKQNSEDRVSPEMKRLLQKIQERKMAVKTVTLDPLYVPNTKDHLYKHAPANLMQKPFTCEIPEYIVEQIMLINDVEDSWKMLLLMGIGVFAGARACNAAPPAAQQQPPENGTLRNIPPLPVSAKYTEVMKNLAQLQKLYLIIASTDYIYGTNYQFCHGYISKDLQEMSQEKCIQAMGRVGRNKLQQDYSVRFRDNALLKKLFKTELNKPEVLNMARLFCAAD
jgi:hypothetical protein